MPTRPAVTADTLRRLRDLAPAADAEPAWPEESWRQLAVAGVLRAGVPEELGGQAIGRAEGLRLYEQLAGACLTTAFILSQRDAAVRRLCEHGGRELLAGLMPRVADGSAYVTVGLSQLTTSHQHQGPAMAAEPVAGGGFRLDGRMPWVTGADRAEGFVTGATMPDGRQVLAYLPRTAPGVRVEPPLDLMALAGSRTAVVVCESAVVEPRWVLAGPVERVMSQGRTGTGGLETSALALGLAGAVIDYLESEARNRAEWRDPTRAFQSARESVRRELLDEGSGGSPERAGELRGRANLLALQASQAAVLAAKGAGFVRSHPAQRWARQALFFLVWSCPRPAQEAVLAQLVPLTGR